MDDKTKVLEREQLDIESLRESDVDLRLPAVVPREPYPIETLAPDARQQTRAVGQRATRPDGRLHGLGQTRYIDDLSFPGMLHARIKRAGIASARIKSIDTSAAEAMPGVMAVLTGKEIPTNSFGPSFQDQPVLVDDLVFHAGDGVAAVAAVTEQIANEALAKIVVEYEPLPAVLDPVAAMREDSPKVHAPNSNIYASKVIRKGDIEKGFAESDHIFEGRFSTQMIEHVSLEPHAAIADWDANGRLTVWATIGRITLARSDMARTLKLPMSRIRIIGTIVGGNFGGKNEITQEPALALLSKKTGRPVKGVFTRGEEFTSTTTRHPIIMDYKSGVEQRRPHHRAPDQAGARRRRLLLVERDHARQGLHPGARPLQDRQCGGGSLRRLHQQDHDRGDARLRRAASVLRLRVAHGRYRQGARQRSAGNTPAQCLRRGFAEPDRAGAA